MLGIFSGWGVTGVVSELGFGGQAPLSSVADALVGDGLEQDAGGTDAGAGQADALQRPPDSKLQTDPGNNRVSETEGQSVMLN